MKKYLIKLNRPLLVIDSNNIDYHTVYGYLSSYEQDKGLDDPYIEYLAAIHCWSTIDRDKFAVDDNKDWIDNEGNLHIVSCAIHDEFVENYGRECKEKLGLDYTRYVIDTNNYALCPDCGFNRSLILCKYVMDVLVNNAEKEEKKEDKQEQDTIILV